jgi:tRNA(Ile2) C34 agmatinyltransferase TiaS
MDFLPCKACGGRMERDISNDKVYPCDTCGNTNPNLSEEAAKRLRDPNFLETLALAMEHVGWIIDMVEVESFYKILCHEAGQEPRRINFD